MQRPWLKKWKVNENSTLKEIKEVFVKSRYKQLLAPTEKRRNEF